MPHQTQNDELNETILLRGLGHFLFGKEKLSPLTIMMLVIHAGISFIFLCWHVLSYFVIKNHGIIIEQKKIKVDELIYERGAALGFDPTLFSSQLTHYHFISSICWLLLLLAVFFMIRKFPYVLTACIVLVAIYYGAMLLNLGTTYYKEDTTSFDKISIVLFLTNAVFYHLITNKAGNKDFFTED